MATMAGKIFIDTNILVYSNNTLSPFCQTARAKPQEVYTNYDSVWVSRQIFREFAAVVSREMQAAGQVNFDELEKTIIRFEDDFQVAEDSGATTNRWLSLLKETNSFGKQVHDTNIAATMLAYGIDTILTHNVIDFKRFSHLIHIVPLL
jgi:predicted nucleic acid-binding protein